MPNSFIAPVRATCPMCREDMIYTAFIVDGVPIWTWVCNCRPQPTTIEIDIANARLEPLTNLVYELEIINYA